MREIERRDRTFHARLSRPGRILSTHYLMATRCIANAIRDTEEVGMAAKTIKNVHGFCTWDEGADCGSCPDHYQLHCKWDRRLFYAFLMLYLPFLVSGWFGMVMTAKYSGAWWYMLAYGAFYIFFFGFFEIRILCSHCPYYSADTGFSLKCLANNGALKVWKYHPEPMNRFERISLAAGFVFLGGFPVFANFYGVYFVAANYDRFSQAALLGMIGLAVITLASALSFFYCLRIYVCSKCVNFSCNLNTVPKAVVDDYLRRNPVMLEAWEKAGYKLGE